MSGTGSDAGRRKGWASLVARYGCDHMAEIGRRGGQASSPDAHAASGHLGGVALVAQRGASHMAEIGAKGNASRSPEAGRAAIRRASMVLHGGESRPVPGLKPRRLVARLSQARLARLAGLTNATHVWKLECGGNAAPRTVEKLARALGCTVDDLQQPSDLMAE